MTLSGEVSSAHQLAWRIGGAFAIVATLISFAQIRMHVRWNTNSRLRVYILRILLMVPIYALESWLGLRFKATAAYFDTMRECYESLVIYSFYAFLVEYLGGERRLVRVLRLKAAHKHMFPFCCLTPWSMGPEFMLKTKLGILQFVVLKPLMAVSTFAFDSLGLYYNGEWSYSTAYPYIMFVDNMSQTVALYCMIFFYLVLKHELQPINPVPKFLVVKSVVFATFWQSVALAILVRVGLLHQRGSYSTENIVTSLQDFLVCIEMFAAALAHHYAFPAAEFHDPDAPRVAPPVFRSIFQAVDVTDVFLDDVESALNADEELLGSALSSLDHSPLVVNSLKHDSPPSPLQLTDDDSDYYSDDGSSASSSSSSVANDSGPAHHNDDVNATDGVLLLASNTPVQRRS